VRATGARLGSAIEKPSEAPGNVVLISNPIAKVCSTEKLEKDGLAKILDKNLLLKLSHRRLSRRRIHR
jgi:hypothetical protein